MQAGKVYLRMVIETVKAGEWIGLGEWYEERWTAYLIFYLKKMKGKRRLSEAHVTKSL